MNKKLLAIAVGAALVATATVATAGEPTFYGKLHMSIDSMDNGGKTVAGVDNSEDGLFVSSNSSRLGIKGAVDLDGGMKVVYKYEMSTDYSSTGSTTTKNVVDTNGDTQKVLTKTSSGLSGNRNAYIGLKGGFGQIIAGRHDMPFKTVGRKHDLFGDTIGDTRAVTRLKDGKDDWADRRDDVVMYTNTFGAIGLKVALGQGELDDKANDTGIGINFKQGPISVMFANETHGKGNFGTTAGLKDSTGNFLAGTYKMGNMTAAAGYLAVDNINGDKDVSATGFTLGGAMKSGMNTFKIQYTSAEADVDGTTGLKLAGTIMAVGVDHKLGKKTTAYAVYAQIDNDNDIDFGFTSTGHAGTVSQNAEGDDPSGFSVGLIHKF